MKASLPILLLALLASACGPSPAEAAAAMEQAYTEALIEAATEIVADLDEAQRTHLAFYAQDPAVSAQDVTIHINAGPVEIEREVASVEALPLPPTGEYERARDVLGFGADKAIESLENLDYCWEHYDRTACDLSAAHWDEAVMHLTSLVSSLEEGAYGDGV